MRTPYRRLHHAGTTYILCLITASLLGGCTLLEASEELLPDDPEDGSIEDMDAFTLGDVFAPRPDVSTLDMPTPDAVATPDMSADTPSPPQDMMETSPPEPECGDGVCERGEVCPEDCVMAQACGESVCAMDQTCVQPDEGMPYCADPCLFEMAVGTQICALDEAFVLECTLEGVLERVEACDVALERCLVVGDTDAVCIARDPCPMMGARRCANGGVEVCPDIGEPWMVAVSNCNGPPPEAFDNGVCLQNPETFEANCYPFDVETCPRASSGALRCSADTLLVQECDGQAWVNKLDCRLPVNVGAQVPGRCDESGPEVVCVPALRESCTNPNTRRCNTGATGRDVVEECDDDVWVAVEDCDVADESCTPLSADDAECSSLTPPTRESCSMEGNTRCFGDRVQACTAGVWVTTANCAVDAAGTETCQVDAMLGPRCVQVGTSACSAMNGGRQCSADGTLIEVCQGGVAVPDTSCVIPRAGDRCVSMGPMGAMCRPMRP